MPLGSRWRTPPGKEMFCHGAKPSITPLPKPVNVRVLRVRVGARAGVCLWAKIAAPRLLPSPTHPIASRFRCFLKNPMPALITHRFVAVLITSVCLALTASACSKKSSESQAAYEAACHGAPLGNAMARNQAMEDGYNTNRIYDCIDKASYVAVNEQAAKWKAANTPEALAKRAAESAEQRARADEARARKAAEEPKPADSPFEIKLPNVNVNTATEAELASVISIGPDVAAQIISARNTRRFADWADLIHRVVGLSAAQTAAYASFCGLNVDGKSLDGAPPDAIMAAVIAQKYQKR